MDVNRQTHFQAQRVISFFISASLLGTDSQANSFSKYIKLALKKNKVKRIMSHELQHSAVQPKHS